MTGALPCGPLTGTRVIDLVVEGCLQVTVDPVIAGG